MAKYTNGKPLPNWSFIFWVAIIIIILIVLMAQKPIQAQTIPNPNINVEKLATAIYYAEGGAKTKYPYGILTKYKTTTPRQACINTIKSNLKRWNGEGDFILFLQKRYAPIGVSNDPTNLNSNWYKNVKRLYERSK